MVELNIPDVFAEVAAGRIRPPISPWIAIDQPQAFPPAFVPILQERPGSNYFGYWKHWFGHRQGTYVQLNLGQLRYVFEIARTPEQFVSHLLLESLSVMRKSTKDIAQFARAVGLIDFEQLVDHFEVDADDPEQFDKLPQYRGRRPLFGIDEVESYDGDFPISVKGERPASWEEVCAFEIDPWFLADLHAEPTLPAWLRGGDQPALFETLLAGGNLMHAWFTLNSPGWGIEEAREALKRLAASEGAPPLATLVEAWNSIKVFDSNEL